MPPHRHLASRSAEFCLLAALALVPTSAGAAGQVIDAVSPPQGTLGTVLSISGSGFGPWRPRVFLLEDDPDGGPPHMFRLNLLPSLPNEIHAQITKALPGPCTLHVMNGVGGEAVADFEVMLPQVGALAPASAAPGDQVVIHGAWFSDKPLSVYFFDKRATVIAAQDDSATVLVPKSLPNGQWTPRVVNPLGSSWGSSALTVSGSSAAVPADFMKASIGGLHFLAQGSGLNASVIGPQVAFSASTAGGLQQLSVQVPFNVSSSPVPSAFAGDGVSTQPVFYLQTDAANGASSMWIAMPGMLPWSVAIVGRSGGHLAGVLDAVLLHIAGPGPDMLHISDGTFIMTPHA